MHRNGKLSDFEVNLSPRIVRPFAYYTERDDVKSPLTACDRLCDTLRLVVFIRVPPRAPD